MIDRGHDLSISKQAVAVAASTICHGRCRPPISLRFKTADQEPLRSAQRQIPAVYRDIGMIYFAAVDPWRASFAWEMGQANPGRSAESDLWGFVRNIDRQVRERRPEFF